MSKTGEVEHNNEPYVTDDGINWTKKKNYYPTFENTSGIEPCGHRVLVRTFQTQRKTEGGILLPENVADKKDKAETKGVLLDYGPTAWKAEGFGNAPWADRGDVVIIGRHEGIFVTGVDGIEYRLLQDEGIQARIVK